MNDVFFSVRSDVELRVFHFLQQAMECDLSFASRLTNVRRFSADCLRRVTNLEAIADMSLESLSLGVYELQSFDILDRVSPGLTSLDLGMTSSKKPRLATSRDSGP